MPLSPVNNAVSIAANLVTGRMASAIGRILDSPHVYRSWQAPFVRQKLNPVLRQQSLRGAKKVLDIGCGPGTNSAYFQGKDYLGLDLNPRYIAFARRRFRRDFLVADAVTFSPEHNEKYDFVLINSLLHHIGDAGVHQLLSNVRDLLGEAGEVHILELELPESPGIPLHLARADRGHYARKRETWHNIFTTYYQTLDFQPYSVGLFGVPLWHMVYFRGKTGCVTTS